MDEVGRGPLAGPVFAAACILPEGFFLPGLKDSKAVSEKGREALFEVLTKDASVIYSVASVSNSVIDTINILQATLLAMKKAVESLKKVPSLVLVDGNELPALTIFMKKMVKTQDKYTLSSSIAAASIIAKVQRDRFMKEVAHKEFPQYGFDKNKGYGTKEHMKALKELGPSPIHRASFAPVQKSKATFFSS